MSGHAGKGGLQKHSIGESYPFAVVGTMHRRIGEPVDKTRYYIVNLVTGAKLYFVGQDDEPRTFVGSQAAHEYAQALANGESNLSIKEITQ
ncbi:hypothetical protein X534_gp09 [Ralstonia phage RSB3]|uniref:Uncharacterized protein n=1 Tax=Ralstonia phage RSB3 TaxID=1402875 RepID=U3TJY1_9CAUD|nr:hypothetical protein X534_gp09 [Ralstonia phage RSB3]BAN92320.1 hypothetical protein [Ralstonia phage RSB3]